MGSAELDRQRAFLAALLALDERGYVLVENHFPERLVAHYMSSYQPDIHQTRWAVRVLDDASLEVAAVAPYDSVHDRTEGWYRSLRMEIQRFQCRELEWLSWKAENQGLMPIGVGLEVGEEVSSGAEQPADLEHKDDETPEDFR